METQYLVEVAIDKIIPNPNNPRKEFNPEKLQELADSIKSVGLLEPLLVADLNENLQYPLVCGERRWRAAQLAGLTSVPCFVRQLTEQQQLEAMVIENLQRHELNPMEEARSFDALVSECGYTEVQVAERIGMSQPYVANRLRLLRLPSSAQERISRGILSPSHARVILGVDGAPPRLFEKLAAVASNQDVSVAAFEDSLSWRLDNLTKPLNQDAAEWERPQFNLDGCDLCEHRCTLKQKGKRQVRCADPDCWKKKQASAERTCNTRRQDRLEAKIAELEQRGERVIRREDLGEKSGEACFFDRWPSCNIDHTECAQCPERFWDVPFNGNTLSEACLNRDCINRKIEERNKREAEVRVQRLERIKMEVSKREVPSRKLLIWAIMTIVKDGYSLLQEYRGEWPVETDDMECLLDYLETLSETQLHSLLTEVLVRRHDPSSNKPLKFYAGFPYPATTEEIMAGKATIDDVQVYTDVEDDGTEASESEDDDDDLSESA